jgi:excisionase family DNA binding protein
MEDEYLTIFEVARITRYAVGTLRKLVLRGQIPFHRIRRSLRFRRSELDLWMKSGGPEVTVFPGAPDRNAPDMTGKGGGETLLFPEEEA